MKSNVWDKETTELLEATKDLISSQTRTIESSNKLLSAANDVIREQTKQINELKQELILSHAALRSVECAGANETCPDCGNTKYSMHHRHCHIRIALGLKTKE